MTQFFAPRPINFVTILLISLGCQAATAQQQAPAQQPTVAGPEVKDIASRVTGYVARTRARREILAVSLPAKKETVVLRLPSDDDGFGPLIHAMSGPNSKGRIAYIEDHFFVANEEGRKHLLKTITIDGTEDKEMFSRPGSAMWAATRAGGGEIGKHLALAPAGGNAALLIGLAEKQMPKALLYEGNIEIWDVEKKAALQVTTKAMDQPMSWFPDGKRLAYVKLVPRDELPKDAPGLEKFGEYFGESWDAVPAIHVLDVETGETRFLHVGWKPIVSFDGKTLLASGWDNLGKFSWNRFDLQSRESSPVQWPGDVGGAIAVPAQNIVLYIGLPTAGRPIKRATYNAPNPQPMLTLKLAVMDSGDFQTVNPDFAPLELVSFGRVTDSD